MGHRVGDVGVKRRKSERGRRIAESGGLTYFDFWDFERQGYIACLSGRAEREKRVVKTSDRWGG